VLAGKDYPLNHHRGIDKSQRDKKEQLLKQSWLRQENEDIESIKTIRNHKEEEREKEVREYFIGAQSLEGTQ
jgi:hypothetical protein